MLVDDFINIFTVCLYMTLHLSVKYDNFFFEWFLTSSLGFMFHTFHLGVKFNMFMFPAKRGTFLQCHFLRLFVGTGSATLMSNDSATGIHSFKHSCDQIHVNTTITVVCFFSHHNILLQSLIFFRPTSL